MSDSNGTGQPANEMLYTAEDMEEAARQALIDAGWAAQMRRLGYPSHLQKAVQDPFDYAMGLRNGAIVRFESAEQDGDDWVRLIGIKEFYAPVGPCWFSDACSPAPQGNPGYFFDRGMNIRLSDIVWVCDAPQGS